jgi:hypothetical protein
MEKYIMKNKKYQVNRSTTVIIFILMLVCILGYILCNLQINIKEGVSDSELAVYKTIKDILLVIISVTGINLLSSTLIEVRSKNNYLSDIITNDVIAAPEFYNNMIKDNKLKMYNALEQSLYFKSKVAHEMYASIRDKLVDNLKDYYYTECSYSVTCTMFDNYIEKEVTRTTHIRSYEGKQNQKDFIISSFSSKKINGVDPYEIKSIEINGQKIKDNDIEKIPSQDKCNLDEQNDYNYFVDYVYKKNLNFEQQKDTVITMKYITRTSKDDRMSTFRVKCPCKKFTLFYSIKQHEKYRLAVNAYGFLDDADNSNNNTSKSDITITFNDWIYKYDGATIVIFDK